MPITPDGRTRWLAAVLTVAAPGLGHVYVGVVRRGIVLASATLILLPIFALLFSRASFGVLQGALPLVIVAGWYAWLIRDAWRQVPDGSVPARRRSPITALVVYFVACLASYAMVREWTRTHSVEAFHIPGGAMEPTILVGDRLYAAPLRGDDVRRCLPVIHHTGGQVLLHRVVGLAGDTILVVNGRVVRNGRTGDELYANLADQTGGDDSVFGLVGVREPLVVPQGHVYLLGDNRWGSLDSRSFGPVPLDSVTKRPTRVYFSRDPETGAIRWRRAGRDLAPTGCGAA